MAATTASNGSKWVRFGPLEYEPGSGLLRRNDGETIVPRRAAQVLARLLETPGDLVSKEDLLEAGWPGVAVADQSLNEAVKVLRKLLDDDPREPRYIQTVYGRGFRFLAPVLVVAEPVPPKGRAWVASAVGALLITAVVFQMPADRVVAPETTKPNIAVLPFDNETGDPSFDWLRFALAELLVTDLSQSIGITVTPVDRLIPMLRVNRAEGESLPQAASRAGAHTVVWGSFGKYGEILRVTMRVEDPATGRMPANHEVEGVGESSVFSIVEELAHRVKVELGLSSLADVRLDTHLKDVTTSSVEAYRLYAEATRLRLQRMRTDDPIPFLERAVAIDPNFALALAKLGNLHGSLKHPKEEKLYLSRAFELADRVTARERYYIEASYHSIGETTAERAIEIYEELLELYPDDLSRHNLGLRYALLERFPEAIEQATEVRRRGLVLHNYELAHANASLGRIDRSFEALEDALSFHGDSYPVHRNFGFVHTWSGRYDEAMHAFDRADPLSPEEPWTAYARWEVSALRDDWANADAHAAEMVRSTEPYWVWRGSRSQAWNALYRGRSAEALDALERAALAYDDEERFSGFARAIRSHVLLETGLMEAAIEEARKAQELGRDHAAEFQGLFYEGLAQARLGELEGARKTAETLRRRTAAIPGNREKRRWHHLEGEIALTAGELERAIEELENARSLLSPRGLHWPDGHLNDHVPVWSSLATAHLAVGNEEQAQHFFSRIAESGYEHLYWPIPYVRSFGFLAAIHRRRGELEKARTLSERFANFWSEADTELLGMTHGYVDAALSRARDPDAIGSGR